MCYYGTRAKVLYVRHIRLFCHGRPELMFRSGTLQSRNVENAPVPQLC